MRNQIFSNLMQLRKSRNHAYLTHWFACKTRTSSQPLFSKYCSVHPSVDIMWDQEDILLEMKAKNILECKRSAQLSHNKSYLKPTPPNNIVHFWWSLSVTHIMRKKSCTCFWNNWRSCHEKHRRKAILYLCHYSLICWKVEARTTRI